MSHGSRDLAAVVEMKQLAQRYQARHPELIVRFGFLESAEPSFLTELEKCAAEFQLVQVLPLFLFQGNHVQKEIPEIIQTVRKKNPQCLIQTGPFLGAHPALAKLALKRLAAAGYAPAVSQQPLLLVGHGTQEKESQDPVFEIKKLLSRENPTLSIEVCFVGLGGPSLRQKLEECRLKFPASSWWAAPYLLFPGFFLEKIQKEISEFQSQNPPLKIFIAPPLSPDEFLFQAMDARRSEII